MNILGGVTLYHPVLGFSFDSLYLCNTFVTLSGNAFQKQGMVYGECGEVAQRQEPGKFHYFFPFPCSKNGKEGPI